VRQIRWRPAPLGGRRKGFQKGGWWCVGMMAVPRCNVLFTTCTVAGHEELVVVLPMSLAGPWRTFPCCLIVASCVCHWCAHCTFRTWVCPDLIAPESTPSLNIEPLRSPDCTSPQISHSVSLCLSRPASCVVVSTRVGCAHCPIVRLAHR
jgi:hypothetical protein